MSFEGIFNPVQEDWLPSEVNSLQRESKRTSGAPGAEERVRDVLRKKAPLSARQIQGRAKERGDSSKNAGT